MAAQVAHHRVVEGVRARHSDPRKPWSPVLGAALSLSGIETLYAHQAEAVDHARAGRHVVVATPTASGKSLCYNLPVMDHCLADTEAKALYLFPLKALAQDQLKGFNELAGLLPVGPGAHRPTAAIYDGDTTPHFRRKIRDAPPNVVMSNPEMVHLSMLPHHAAWAGFLAGLSYVVVDEVHTYRGVMGSHMAMVFRRLLRLCAYYGAHPTFLFSSATIGNPVELCRMLTGLDVHPVLESGAARGRRHVVFINPEGSPAQAAIELLRAALAREMRTIVYCQSRKLTELVALWASERGGEYRDRISAYRAGFLPEERREIEARMASGELLAVISTSALELGIDIGGLDLCIMVGYPGSIMATWQRGGRVGRTARDSVVALVAQEDALDQYFMRHPEDFFARPPESAMLNPFNPVIMDRHLICAAAELTLRRGEGFLREEAVGRRVDELVTAGHLCEVVDTASGHPGEIVTYRKRPHGDLDLRGAGRSMHIEDVTGDDSCTREGRRPVIGTLDAHRAFREAHPGAVYLHRGRTYVIEDMDMGSLAVRARRARVGYYTRPRGSKDTEILEVLGTRTCLGTRVHFGRLKVTEQITGYEKRAVRGGKLLGITALDLPPLRFETEGLWFEIPHAVRVGCEAGYLHFMGGIHAFEHAAIGMLPLLVMTDRNDLGGISTPMHPQVNGPAVFIYDGMPGGAGLTRQAFEQAEELLLTTLRTIDECPCETGCPSCVHSPKCGSGNRPIDKSAARYVLESIRTGAAPATVTKEVTMTPSAPFAPGAPRRPAPERFGVIDIETRYSADEVGGWHRADRMGVSVACVWDSGEESMFDYGQDDLDGLVSRLRLFDLVIGFNHVKFDYAVLGGLHPFAFRSLPSLDLLVEINARLGYRLKLDNVARATLGGGKSADGLMALKWWKEGRLDLITEYCRDDVAATRDLYLHGREHGHIFFTNKAGQKVRLPVGW
nr:DEAD/DEAH box helicase [Pseudodesulfovibrio alkaliphilus]